MIMNITILFNRVCLLKLECPTLFLKWMPQEHRSVRRTFMPQRATMPALGCCIFRMEFFNGERILPEGLGKIHYHASIRQRWKIWIAFLAEPIEILPGCS